MSQKRVPIKGEPDFTNISNERLRGYADLIEQMIFSYKGVSDEKVRVLKDISKELSAEKTNRLCESANTMLEKQVDEVDNLSVHKIKPVKRIKR